MTRFLHVFLISVVVLVLAGNVGLAGSSPCELVRFPTLKPASNLPYLFTNDHRDFAGEVTLTVDTSGRAIDVVIDSTVDSMTARAVSDWLKRVQYLPGTRDGRPATLSQRIAVVVLPQAGQPHLVFGQNSSGAVLDQDLYAQSLELQGIKLPRLQNFPSYFIKVRPDDTIMPEPSAVFELELDKLGRIRDRQVVASSLGPFTSQLADAALWSRWQAGTVGDTNQPSSVRILIRMIRQLSYPTRPFKATAPDTLTAASRYRVQAHACRGQLLSPPVPRPGASLDDFVKLKTAPRQGQFIVRIITDSTGSPRLFGTARLARSLGRSESALAIGVDFYPGLSWEGVPVRCIGHAVITFSYDHPTTVKYYWSSLEIPTSDISDSVSTD